MVMEMPLNALLKSYDSTHIRRTNESYASLVLFLLILEGMIPKAHIDMTMVF